MLATRTATLTFLRALASPRMLLPTLRTLLDGGHLLVLLTTDLIRCALPPAPQQRSYLVPWMHAFAVCVRACMHARVD